MKIEEIPDYPALEQLANALWKAGKARGAAVLVGAGFSRNAELLNGHHSVPPLWTDMARAMQARLYPNVQRPKEPLRLAEEFNALLGPSALESLIRDLVPDEEWLPGELHHQLVRLPWTDILTTNWDTLLERAALENLGQTYETVRCIGDIATTRAPRIVKLHGSLPSNRPFILTEEDYRTYPHKFAPFVNFVQQALLENELCLLGFSGDDPNFLEWSGWVRDQLGVSARRIHLVGALDLSVAERRLFETRNISAIDLTPLLDSTEGSKHQAAARIFLDYLERSRPRAPWEWPKGHGATPTAKVLQGDNTDVRAFSENLLRKWEGDRSSYPGWVVCPPHIQSRAKQETISSLIALRSLNALPPTERGQFVFETAWRHETFFVPLQDWVQEAFEQTIRNDECWEEIGARNFVTTVLLRTAREERDKQSFEEWQAYLERQPDLDPECRTSLVYQLCLWARDELDFLRLRELLADLEGSDPLWKLRRCALLCDLGEFSRARELVHAGLHEIREQFYRDRNSVWTISRLAWAHFLSTQLRSWTELDEEDPLHESEILRLRFFETKSDPWETLKAVDIQIEEDLRRIAERSKTVEPLFDAGVYRIHSRIEFGTWWPTQSIYDIWRTTDVAGIPARADHTIIMAPRMERAEVLTGYKYEDDGDYLRGLRIAQAEPKELVETLFGRMRVAMLSEGRCSMLREVLNRALDYSLAQLTRRESYRDDFWSRRCAVYCEILSRLAVRLSQPDAAALFRKALLFAADPRWKSMELHEPLKHLLERALSAIAPHERHTHLLEMVSFPLPMEAGVPSQMARDWPEAAGWLWEFPLARPNPDQEFAARVSSLIERVANADAENRARAASRLVGLFMGGALNQSEGDRFGVALWSRRKSPAELPADTTLYSHVFLLLPCPDRQAAVRLFLLRDHEPSSADHLIALAGATRKRKDGTIGLTLTKEQALKKLHDILGWRPPPVPEIDVHDVRGQNRASSRAIGGVLADAILPPLEQDDLQPDLVEQCFALIETEVAVSAAEALPELMRAQPQLEERVADLIIRLMYSRDEEKNSASFQAMYRWVDLAKDEKIPWPPRRLQDAVVYMTEARREPGLRWALIVARKLLEEGSLAKEDSERLIAALELIFLETDYQSGQSTEPESNSIALLRSAAVRIAFELKRRGSSDQRLDLLLTKAKCDPMPEVRFASDSSDE